MDGPKLTKDRVTGEHSPKADGERKESNEVHGEGCLALEKGKCLGPTVQKAVLVVVPLFGEEVAEKWVAGDGRIIRVAREGQHRCSQEIRQRRLVRLVVGIIAGVGEGVQSNQQSDETKMF